MWKILSSGIRLGAVRTAAKRIANTKTIFSLILTKKSSVNIVQQRFAGSYSEYKKTNPYSVRNLFNTWGRVPFIRIGVTPTKFPLKRFWSWGALLSIAFFIPLVNIPAYLLLNGFAINAYRDKILTSSLVNSQILPAYKNERISTLLKDGIWVLVAPALFTIIMSIPAVLFQGTNTLVFMALASPAFLAAFLLTFFAPLMAAYALVNQDKKSKWISILNTTAVRQIWRSLGPAGRSNYKHAALSALAATFVCFFVSSVSLGILSGPALLWSYLTVAEIFGDLFSNQQHKLRAF
jgi:hypothetical protein